MVDVLSAIAVDAGTLVYATDAAIAELRAIAADPTRDEGEKATAILSVMQRLMTQGLIFFASNRDLFIGGPRSPTTSAPMRRRSALATLRQARHRIWRPGPAWTSPSSCARREKRRPGCSAACSRTRNNRAFPPAALAK